ncbi:putative pectate lyase A [Teratosphaeria destructans]|uniref:Pectate lyase A n=1 Tax=Teratosphaeria destructans TaxID=418781 RepID=A0A9W7SYR0_9PEZI|nr:putative pectate lyase A [Teratosphaeria destructans]
MRFNLLVGVLATTAQLARAYPTLSYPSNVTKYIAPHTNGTRFPNSTSNSTDGPIGYASLYKGTTGGQGGRVTTVSSLDDFKAAVDGDKEAIVYISGAINGSGIVRVGANKSILGKNSHAALSGVGLVINGAYNVIIRNIAISKVKSGNYPVAAVGILGSGYVWLDHLDLSSDKYDGQDYYADLVDIDADSDHITVSNTYFHDHFKASRVGYGDKCAALQVTFANNYWKNIDSNTPLVEGGKAHIFNSFFEDVACAIDVPNGSQVLFESNDFGTSSKHDRYDQTMPNSTLGSVPYKYTLLGASKVAAAVKGVAGNTLNLG